MKQPSPSFSTSAERQRWHRAYYPHSQAQAARMADKWNAEWSGRFAAYVAEVQRYAGPDGQVLDLGCGGGQTTYGIAAGVRGVIGLDISALSFTGRPPQPDNVTLAVADAASLPFADGSFAVVAMHDAIEHFPDAAAVLREALRVLRPGGWLIVHSPNLIAPHRALSLYLQGRRRPPRHPDGSLRFGLYSLWLNLAKRIGLSRAFTYRRPLVDGLEWRLPDMDAICLASPHDLIRFARRHGLRIVRLSEGSSPGGRWLARLFPRLAGGIAFAGQCRCPREDDRRERWTG